MAILPSTLFTIVLASSVPVRRAPHHSHCAERNTTSLLLVLTERLAAVYARERESFSATVDENAQCKACSSGLWTCCLALEHASLALSSLPVWQCAGIFRLWRLEPQAGHANEKWICLKVD